MKTLATRLIPYNYNCNFLFVAVFILFLIISTKNIFAEEKIVKENFWAYTTGPKTSEPNVIKFNLKDELFISAWGDGIYYNDGISDNYIKRSTGLTDNYIQAIEIDSSGNLYAGTVASGVFKSTNNGVYWTPISNGLTNLNVKCLLITKKGDIFAGTYGNGVFRLKKDSSSWENLTSSFWFLDVTALTVSKENTIIAGTNGGGIYRSKNNGADWAPSNAGLSCRTVYNFVNDYSVGEIYAFTSGNGVMSSVSDGADWAFTDTLTMPMNVTCGVLNKNKEVVVGTQDRSIWWFDRYMLAYWRLSYASEDGVYSMSINSKGVIYSSAANGNFFISKDNGRTWTKKIFTAVGYANNIIAKNNYVWATGGCGADNKLYFSEDYGVSWKYIDMQGLPVFCIALDSNYVLYAGSIDGLYKSTDFGNTWIKLFTDTIYSVEIKNTNPVTIFLSGFSYYFHVSTDGGENWNSYPVLAQYFSTIKIRNNGEIWAGCENAHGIWKSTNNGLSFINTTTDEITCTGIAFKGQDSILAATSDGLYISTNSGNTWHLEDFDIPYRDLSDVYVAPNNDIYCSLTYYLGFFYSTDDGITWDSLNSGFIRTKTTCLTGNYAGYIYLGASNLYRTVIPDFMLTPKPTTPKNEQIGVDLSPTLIWNKAERAELYEMQIAFDMDFKNIIESVVLKDTFRVSQRTFDYNKLLFWRVRSKTNSSYSNWSNTQAFRTIFKAPTLVSPKNETKGLLSELTLIWNTVEGANRYSVQVAKDSLFKDIVVNKTGLIDTTLAINKLLLKTKYFWRVCATNEYAVSSWSSIWWFKTKLLPPELRSPENKSWGHPSTVIMTWDTIQDASRYFIQIAKDTNFTNVVFFGQTENNSFHTILNLEPFTQYYWRVQSSDGGINPSDWSQHWSYITYLNKPTQRLPLDSSVNIATNTKIEWHEYSDTVKYYLQVSTDDNFNNVIFQDSAITNTNVALYLENYKNYYWRLRVKALDKYISEWSDIWTFRTIISPSVLIEPLNNKNDENTNLICKWNTVIGSNYYRIQLAKDSLFTSIIKDYDSLDQTRKEIYGLEYETDYWWRVFAYSIDDHSVISEVWKFRTKTKSSIIDYNTNNTLLVYPNPIKNKANITFLLNQDSYITIDIIDQIGEVVHTLCINEYMLTGKINKELIINELPNAAYYIRIKSNNEMIIKKIIIQR